MGERFRKRLNNAQYNIDELVSVETAAGSTYDKLNNIEIDIFIIEQFSKISDVYKAKGSVHSFGSLWSHKNYRQIFIDCYEDLFKEHPYILRKLSDNK